MRRLITLLIGLVFCSSLWGQEKALTTHAIVVVGQYSCPACQDALPSLGLFAPKWKALGYPVRYYSLDAKEEDYTKYPVPVTRLAKRWEDPMIKKLGTYATPSYYLLDPEGEIIEETATAAEMQLRVLTFKKPTE